MQAGGCLLPERIPEFLLTAPELSRLPGQITRVGLSLAANIKC